MTCKHKPSSVSSIFINAKPNIRGRWPPTYTPRNPKNSVLFAVFLRSSDTAALEPALFQLPSIHAGQFLKDVRLWESRSFLQVSFVRENVSFTDLFLYMQVCPPEISDSEKVGLFYRSLFGRELVSFTGLFTFTSVSLYWTRPFPIIVYTRRSDSGRADFFLWERRSLV